MDRRTNAVLRSAKHRAVCCYYCYSPFDRSLPDTITIDHFFPLAKDGADENHNKVIVCWWCNKLKADYGPVEFLELLAQLKRATKHGVVQSRCDFNIMFAVIKTILHDYNARMHTNRPLLRTKVPKKPRAQGMLEALRNKYKTQCKKISTLPLLAPVGRAM